MFSRKMNRSVVGLCVALTIMLGLAHAAPQPFSQGEQSALAAQSSGSHDVGTLQCGMSGGAKAGIIIAAVVVVVVAVIVVAAVVVNNQVNKDNNKNNNDSYYYY